MTSRRRGGRSGAVATALGVVVGLGIATAGPATALPTLPCDLKPKVGQTTLDVTIPAGRGPDHPYVVCAGNSVDTVTISSIGDPTSSLYLAMGNGQKTINWQAGNVEWGDDIFYFPSARHGTGLITRPPGNPPIIMRGYNNTVDGAYFTCGTNSEYRSAGSTLDYVSGGRSLNWWMGSGVPHWTNANGC